MNISIFKIFISCITIICLMFGSVVGSVRSQEAAIPSLAPTPTPIDYQMPYPGLLPDHPLYFFKVIRDKIQGFFISDYLKKAEYSLHQADKRIESSFILVQHKPDKLDLAQDTFSKGENYFEDAIIKTQDANSQGIRVADFSRKLFLANQKHQEILASIKKKIGENSKNSFKDEEKRLVEMSKKVKELNQQN